MLVIDVLKIIYYVHESIIFLELFSPKLAICYFQNIKRLKPYVRMCVNIITEKSSLKSQLESDYYNTVHVTYPLFIK